MNLKKFASLLVLIIVLSFVSAQTNHSNMEHTKHDVNPSTENSDFAEREQAVMPFDLEATLHIFKDTATGGIQQVIANDSLDNKNIDLIRSHLMKEATAFAQGIFNDPSYLHSEAMPGLAELQAAGKAGLLEVIYQDLDNGGEIVYRSSDKDVVIALHLWFQAQVIDHGDHATN